MRGSSTRREWGILHHLRFGLSVEARKGPTVASSPEESNSSGRNWRLKTIPALGLAMPIHLHPSLLARTPEAMEAQIDRGRKERESQRAKCPKILPGAGLEGTGGLHAHGCFI